jgi:uncharacterized membrane-anchored protein YjiN (DUF445 family)
MTALLSPPMSGEAERLRQLHQMKRRATGLLGVMAVLFMIVTVWGHGRGWSGYLQATLEASLVGGLADWFAVTALFRHPLGLPIPHTAVIPERKEQFGRTLGEFVQENFFRPDVLSERIRSANLARRSADWLAEVGNAEIVVGRMGDLARMILDTGRDGELGDTLEKELRRTIEAIPVAPTAARLVEFVTAHGLHRELFDQAVDGLERLLATQRPAIQARFHQQSPWWLPEIVDDRIFGRLFDGVQRALREISADPDHEVRREFDRWASSLGDRLRHSPDLLAKGEQLKQRLLGRRDLADSLRALLTEAQTTLRAQLIDPESGLRRRLVAAVTATAERFRNDPILLAKAEDGLESAARSVARQFQDDIADLVSGTVARWDGQETAHKLELLLGKDLQYIRINGTIVGGLAGLGIHIVARAIG